METIANGSSQKNLSPVEDGCFEIPFNQEIQEIFSNKSIAYSILYPPYYKCISYFTVIQPQPS